MADQGGLFDSMGPPPAMWVDDPRLVRPHQLEAWGNWIQGAPELVLDYETDGLVPRDGHRPFMVGAFSPDKGAKVVDLRLTPQALEALRVALRGRTGTTIVHNAKNELGMSWAMGTDIGGKLWDNQAASFAYDERRDSHGQKELCKLFGFPTPMADALGAYMQATFGNTERGHHHNPNALEVPYNCEDVESAWRIYERQKADCQRAGLLDVVEIDSEVCRPICEMENTGINLDVGAATRLLEELTEARAACYKTICAAVGRPVDPSSHQALFGVLYGHWGLPMHHDVEKVGKLDDDVLAWMTTLPQVREDSARLTFVEGVRDWREYDKMIGTYLLPWLYEHARNGILYPHLNTTVATTKRLSADSPNLQNIPARGTLGKRVRALIVAMMGHETYSFDYSQVEYRTFAHCSGEPRLVKGYRDLPDFDIHASVSDLLNSLVAGLGMLRDDGKHVNFGILYGMGIDKLSRKLRCSKDRAKKILDAYMQGIPTVRALKKRLEREVQTKGYVSSVLGGRRHLNPNEAYKALNTLCQMTAAEIIRHAMVQAYRRRPAGLKFQLQVHDELLFSIPGPKEEHGPALATVKAAMEDMPKFNVPMRVDGERFAPNWAKKETV